MPSKIGARLWVISGSLPHLPWLNYSACRPCSTRERWTTTTQESPLLKSKVMLISECMIAEKMKNNKPRPREFLEKSAAVAAGTAITAASHMSNNTYIRTSEAISFDIHRLQLWIYGSAKVHMRWKCSEYMQQHRKCTNRLFFHLAHFFRSQHRGNSVLASLVDTPRSIIHHGSANLFGRTIRRKFTDISFDHGTIRVSIDKSSCGPIECNDDCRWNEVYDVFDMRSAAYHTLATTSQAGFHATEGRRGNILGNVPGFLKRSVKFRHAANWPDVYLGPYISWKWFQGNFGGLKNEKFADSSKFLDN